MNANTKGFLCLVLHAHLPFVRHPEWEQTHEEIWLFEAITESYLPLLQVLEGLDRDGVDFRLTMSFTPTLCSMLRDQLLEERYLRHLENLIELSEKELDRTAGMPKYRAVAEMYHRKLKSVHDSFVNVYKKDVLSGFMKFQEKGKLEIITCSATHGFLPLLRSNPEAVRAQVQIGAQHYKDTFGRPAKGIWNAECGFYPGLDEELKDAGIRYFFVDAHGILFAEKRPAYGIFAPLYCPSGVAAFGRDIESSRSVWSAEEGYPGDHRYREFYRDLGYDLDYDYIRPHIHESGLRIATGFKYYKITGKVELKDKEPYDEGDAREAAAQHAGNFLFNRQHQVLHLSTLMNRPPVIVSPYDAELFGHWWFEGPQFLDFLFRKMHFDQDDIAPVTPSEYLDLYPENQVAMPSYSSWGHKGYSEVWLDNSNDWIYRHVHKASDRMVELARKFDNPTKLERRALNQAARELLLAQSSDWAFIMKMKTMVEYAEKRTKDHILRFTDFYEQLMAGKIDEQELAHLEYKDNIFPDLDYKIYAGEMETAE